MTSKPAFAHILNVADARRAAARRLPRGLFEYVDRGSEDEVSIATNRSQLDAIKLSPAVLVDVSQRSTEAEILGQRQPLPLVIAPTAVAGLVWHDGEIAIAKAAAAAGIPFCVATQSITSVERIAAESGARLWFQLYVWKNRQRMLALLERAWASGAETLVRVHEPVSVLDFLDPASGRHTFPIDAALKRIAQHGNGVIVLLYRPQSGQELLAQLATDPTAPRAALKWDPRLFGVGAQILRELQVGKMRLMASPRKIPSMTGFGLTVVGHAALDA